MNIRLTRTFNAPRARVFSWWACAEKVQQWSGCAEMTSCSVEMDFRPGGSFTQTMQLSAGCEFTIAGVYDEIVEPRRIAYRVRIGDAMTRVVIDFFDRGGQTDVVLTHDGLPDEMTCSQITRGTRESLEALQGLLEGVEVP
jgi:uncharacterized protein YndB with AHSA1/START domain